MTQIKVARGPQELDITDKVARVLNAVFNQRVPNDTAKVKGLYTKPYSIMDQFDENTVYLFDEMESDQQIQMFEWREWGLRADTLIKGLLEQGLEIRIKEKQIE